MLTIEEEVDALVAAGLLTGRQAEAFVHREVELTPRPQTADAMGISVNTLDNTLAAAKRKVTAARETVETVEAIRNQLPAETDD